MGKKSVWLGGIFVFFLSGVLAAPDAFAQCGNYFKTNYRAVGKLRRDGSMPGSFGLNDWTGDGRPDWWNLRINAGTGTDDIVIYPSKPAGYWDWDNPIVYTSDIPSAYITDDQVLTVKDFDGDGDRDLHFANRIFRNNGNGTFSIRDPSALLNTPIYRLGFYDIDGDGRLDLLDEFSQSGQGHSIAYYAGNANGTFDAGVVIFTGTELLGSVARFVGDFNGDGRVDIAYQTASGIRLLTNTGGGNFAPGSVLPVTNPSSFIDTRDFNGDGRADLIGIGGAPRKLVIYYGQANGTFTETAQLLNNQSLDGVKVVELNGDDHPDVIEFGGNQYRTYLNNGTNVFAAADYQRGLGGRFFADFSGDGKDDVYDDAGGAANIFGEPILYIKENVCDSFGETKKADFNGDSIIDLAVWNSATGNWRVDLLDRLINTGSIRSFDWGAGSLGDRPALGDYDGDGRTDYTVYRNSTGQWYSLLSSNSAWSVISFGLPGDISVPADYDGGGRTDIAVFRPSDGNWYFWITETQTFGAVHFGANGDKPVPEDYDGDGQTDAAVYRPATGAWYILRSSDANFGVVNWGIATDIPAPADYDGDGKADIAVFRDGQWYILRSLNNSFNVVNWGSAGDKPMPVVTERGFAQLMVYRESIKAWYYYGLPYGGTFNVTFGYPGYAPVYFGMPNN